MASEVNFRAVPADVGDAAVLVGAMVEEMRELYRDVGGEGSGGDVLRGRAAVDLSAGSAPPGRG